MINIERMLLCSILEHNFIPSEDKIMTVELDAKYFTHKNHKVFVNAINRLKELDEPIDSDTIRHKFNKVGRWENVIREEMSQEQSLLEIMTARGIGSHSLFMNYYNFLKNDYEEKEKIESLRYI